MRKKEEYKLQKVTLNLRDGDVDYLRALHGREGASKVIRNLVIAHIKEREAILTEPLRELLREELA